MKKSFKTITPQSRSDFRSWLSKNHLTSQSVWIVIYKKVSALKNLDYADVVEECLCFGWIDSVPSKVDDNSYKLLVSPRKPKSVWSAVNKKKINGLVKKGLMTQAGLAKIKLAKSNGSWEALNQSDQLVVPIDLAKALRKNTKAASFFSNLAPSYKRSILEWIYAAKTDSTREKRIENTVKMSALGLRANHYLDVKKYKTL
jgi:uncharacterized protein YdeI (YjbR/CyaY-like superfamily)